MRERPLPRGKAVVLRQTNLTIFYGPYGEESLAERLEQVLMKDGMNLMLARPEKASNRLWQTKKEKQTRNKKAKESKTEQTKARPKDKTAKLCSRTTT